MSRLEFFGRQPPAGTQFFVRGQQRARGAPVSARTAWNCSTPRAAWDARWSGAGYWRFYLPFGDVNFFGPKDQYFLSSARGRQRRGVERDLAGARCYYLEPPLDLQQPVLRASGSA